MSKQVTLETITNLAKRRGFVFQASEIYGGLAGFYDYGPYGVELLNNLKRLWWKTFVHEQPNIFGLDSAIIQHPKLWEASGHVDTFTDPIAQCSNCNHLVRADHLIGKDTNDPDEINQLIQDKACPNCGKKGQFAPVQPFNMMMKTYVGAVENKTSLAYLRPETAGGMYVNYENVMETTRAKIPFGIAQIGKAFRNEISPRDWLFRKRELEQAEMQYFVHEQDQKREYERWREFTWQFYTDRVGIDKKNLKWHEHDQNERAHYAATAHDIQYEFAFGFKEIAGVHNRTDFDLKSHMEASGKDLSYFDQNTQEKFVPNVIESSIGIDRLFMAALTDAYTEEKVKGETRVVLKLKPEIAPIQVAVLPLSKNEKLTPFVQKVYSELKDHFVCEYDETQSIGRRYRRQDEIGTPYCVTVDFDSLDDDAVTVRDRDSMKQDRVKIKELNNKLQNHFNG